MTDRTGARAIALRALSDDALIAAMREGDELAWGEFIDRFRPLLESFARRTGIPRWDWDACITDVLEDEALKFVARATALPASLAAYLIRAVHNRRLRLKRAALVRERYYAAANEAISTSETNAVVALCSESTALASAGPDAVWTTAVSSGLVRLAEALRSELSEEELLLLTWRGASVPLRQVAAWLGISYDAAAKRTLRLCSRLRASASLKLASFPPEERRDIHRLFQRVDKTSRRGAGT